MAYPVQYYITNTNSVKSIIKAKEYVQPIAPLFIVWNNTLQKMLRQIYLTCFNIFCLELSYLVIVILR